MQYAFILGREPALSIAELVSRLQADDLGFDPKTAVYSPAVMIAEVSKPLDVAWFNTLGGSIKMAQVLHESQALEDDLYEALSGLGEGSIDFGVSLYSLESQPSRPFRSLERGMKALSLTLKKRLKASGRSARVVLGEGAALSSVQVSKNGLIGRGAEMLILFGEKRVVIARTIVVQAFEHFSERDFGRPGRDAKSGMLPPKLARMMVNIAGGPKNEALADPFCGSGTVLSEAAVLGYRDLVASDISPRAVADTDQNLAWTIKQSGLHNLKTNIFEADVRHLPSKLPTSSVTTIVSEPFLGPPMQGDESDQKIHFVHLELMGLYRRAFEAFAKILKRDGVVVFVFPFFGSKHVSILREIEALGFKAEAILPGKAAEALGLKTPVGLSYKREDQKVGRDIYRFRFVK